MTSYLNKNYTFAKQENLEEFLKVNAVPAEAIAKLLSFNPAQKLVKNGDTYSYIIATPEDTREIKFKSGVEFEDVFAATKTPVKTTYVVDGNTVTQTMKGPKGNATFKREYNGNDLVMTITMDTWDGFAKSYYKAE